MHSVADDQNLIIAAKEGNEQALEKLFEKYRGLIIHICKTYYIQDGDYDDLKQAAAIGFWKSILDYRPEFGKDFKNFAFLCIKRQLGSRVRKSMQKKQMLLNNAVSIYDYSDDDTIFQHTVTPENIFLEQEAFLEKINTFSSLLTDLESKVLFLRMSDMSYKEIAIELKIDRKSVDNAIQRIKKKLRQTNF